jgi:glycosyltransferase involved in cell wall biosynthesis
MDNKENLIIVNHGFLLGGPETFFLKILPYFQEKFNIKIILTSKKINKELLESLPQNIDIIYWNNLFPFTKKKIKQIIGNIDYIFSTLPQCYILSLVIAAIYKNKVKIIISPHQTESFCATANIFRFHRFISMYLLKFTPDENIIFVNDAIKKHHSTILKRSFKKSWIIGLFVDPIKFKFISQTPKARNRIIAVGRLAPYKTYNLYLIDVFKKLNTNGSNLILDIYGDGELRGKMENLIKKNNVKNVHLKGSLSYKDFPLILKNYFLFIGSGTSVIEASLAGIPSITTIENDLQGKTYGLFSKIKGKCYIEPNLNLKKYFIDNIINNVQKLSNKDYKQLKISSHKKALQFADEEIIKNYFNAFNKSKLVKLNKFMILIYSILYLTGAIINILYLFIKKNLFNLLNK